MMRPQSGTGRRRRAGLRGRRASVSVEFALVSLFFLFPLIAGGIDMLLVLSARSKLNSALHAIYLFAWSDPQDAGDQTQLQTFIQSIDPQLPASSISLANAPSVIGVCFNANGSIDPGATFVSGLVGNVVTGVLGSATSSNTCKMGGMTVPNDVPILIATYKLQSVIQLPVPVPFLANPITLTAGGTIQVE
jgi:Flp pilus assembly protein TadG